MAYIDKQKVSNIRELLKKEFKGYKFSVKKENNSGVAIYLLASDLNFELDLVRSALSEEVLESTLKKLTNGCYTINPYSLDNVWSGETLKVFKKILEIAKSQEWFDKSDSMIDYYNTAYYIDLYIGRA